MIADNPRFIDVSDTPGTGATAEQLAMLYNRYRFVASRCEGKDVLEIACGPGFGLGYLARVARSVQGGDIDPDLVAIGQSHYGNRIPVQQMDALQLPFEDASLDVVAILEAVYYLPDADAFVEEARRVLRPGGELIIVTVNREWTLFNPGAHTVRYFSASELAELYRRHGFEPSVFVAFPDRPAGLKTKILRGAKKLASKLHLIPENVSGKERLKKLLYGDLQPIPKEVTPAMAEEHEWHPAPAGPITSYSLLLSFGRKA
ncbi:MAG: Ubiquinone biosynthesis O-methyltransferase [Fimbriimonadaceae bacterium]|nr:Ubiquinone biosynthesis O-methyltransferase [Fimbriimonadaceae bacterium]